MVFYNNIIFFVVYCDDVLFLLCVSFTYHFHKLLHHGKLYVKITYQHIFKKCEEKYSNDELTECKNDYDIYTGVEIKEVPPKK